MADDVLVARALRKSFRSGDRSLLVLRGVDFAVGPSQSVSIRGESGSGKSTLLNLLAGLDTPDSGELIWAGYPKIDHAARARFLGIIFQSFYLIPELNAVENVLMAKRILGKVGPTERALAEKMIDRVGLGERKHHLPSQLSGGERQRVAVARALINGPQLILADEPTGNLDEETGNSVIDLLLGVCSELRTALVLVTHNPAHAAKTSRRLSLKEGILEDVHGSPFSVHG